MHKSLWIKVSAKWKNKPNSILCKHIWQPDQIMSQKNVLKNMQYMWNWFKFSVLCLFTVHLCKQWVIRSFEYFMHTESVHIVHSILTIYSRNTLVGLWESLTVSSLWRLWTHYPHCRFTHTEAMLRAAHLHATLDKTHIWNCNTEALAANYGSYLLLLITLYCKVSLSQCNYTVKYWVILNKYKIITVRVRNITYYIVRFVNRDWFMASCV